MTDPISIDIGYLVVKHLLEKQPLVKKQVAAFKRLIKRGKLSVLILGASGTGKSTLGHLFSAVPEPGTRVQIPGAIYAASMGKEEGKVEGYWFTDVAVLPGQRAKQRQGALFNAAMADLRDGKIHGIVHVVSAGIHSSYAGQVQFPYLFDGPGNYVLSSTDIQKRLHVELDLLRELSKHVRERKKESPLWIITAINKQDLWYKYSSAVMRHYQNGAYGEEIKRLKTHCGKSVFSHEFLELCLKIENYIDQRGRVSIRTASGYDARIQFNTIVRIVAQLSTFCSIELNTKNEKP